MIHQIAPLSQSDLVIGSKIRVHLKQKKSFLSNFHLSLVDKNKKFA